MKKILIVVNLTSFVNKFYLNEIKEFHKLGYQVDLYSSLDIECKDVDNFYEVKWKRNPLKNNILKEIKKMKLFLLNNKYDLVYSATPMGGLISRLAIKKIKIEKRPISIYFAHGFHFYKGGNPLLNFVYRNVEKYLSKYSDGIITLNDEDYKSLTKYKFKNKRSLATNGVGFDTDFYLIKSKELSTIEKEFIINKDDIVLTYTAEINKNKNQYFLVNCLVQLLKINPNIKLILLGKDNTNGKINKLIKKLHLESKVILPGRRNDVYNFLKRTNIYVASSIREGLGINIVEAFAFSLPVVAFSNRGHRQLIKNGYNGFLYNNKKEYIGYIKKILDGDPLVDEIRKNAFNEVNKYNSTKCAKEVVEFIKSFL